MLKFIIITIFLSYSHALLAQTEQGPYTITEIIPGVERIEERLVGRYEIRAVRERSRQVAGHCVVNVAGRFRDRRTVRWCDETEIDVENVPTHRKVSRAVSPQRSRRRQTDVIHDAR